MDTVLVATSANPRVLPSGGTMLSLPPPSGGGGATTPSTPSSPLPSALATTGGAAPPGDPFCGAITVLSLMATVLRDGLRSVPRAAAMLDLLSAAVGRRGATDGRIRRLPLRVLTLVDLATAAADNRLVRVGGGTLTAGGAHCCTLRASGSVPGDRPGGASSSAGARGSAGGADDWTGGDAGGTLCVIIGRASAATTCGDGGAGCGGSSCWTAGPPLADGPAAPGEQLLVEVVPYDQDACAICLGEYTHCMAVVQLPCGHIFHRPCISAWLLRQNVCPCCKREAC